MKAVHFSPVLVLLVGCVGPPFTGEDPATLPGRGYEVSDAGLDASHDAQSVLDVTTEATTTPEAASFPEAGPDAQDGGVDEAAVPEAAPVVTDASWDASGFDPCICASSATCADCQSILVVCEADPVCMGILACEHAGNTNCTVGVVAKSRSNANDVSSCLGCM